MKRTIKFRAYHPYTKEMMPVETIDWDETGYLTEVEAGYCWSEKYDPQKFHRLILMQYTGLKDKNGREIYEGDILEFNRKKMQELKYEPVREVVTYSQGQFLPRPFKGEDCEIIGNIYETPNLLQS